MFEKEIEMLEKLQNISHHHLDYVTCQSAMESLSNAEAELTQLRAEVERLKPLAEIGERTKKAYEMGYRLDASCNYSRVRLKTITELMDLKIEQKDGAE